MRPTPRHSVLGVALLLSALFVVPARAVPDGLWIPLGPPVGGGVAVHDPVRGQVWFLNQGLPGGLWSLSLAPPHRWVWRELPGIAGGDMVYDPERDRLLLFNAGTLTGAVLLGATPTWTPLSATGSPTSIGPVVYDAATDRVLEVGGDGQVSALSLGVSPAWSVVSVTSALAEARTGHTALFDPIRNRLLIFGGATYQPGCFSFVPTTECWALPLSGTPTWVALSPMSGQGGTRPVLYDDAGDRAVVVGGGYSFDCGGPPFVETYQTVDALPLTGGSWSTIHQLPKGRAQHGAIHDPANDRLVVVGGRYDDDTYPMEVFSDAIAIVLGGPDWVTLARGIPPGRGGAFIGLDPTRGEVLLQGGNGPVGPWGDHMTYSDTWRYLDPDSLWREMDYGHGAQSAAGAVDVSGDRLVLFGGGYDSSYPVDPLVFLNHVTAFALANGVSSYPTVSGTPPSPRMNATAAYDPVRARLLVFGGVDEIAPVNDLHALALDGSWVWSMPSASGTPPAAGGNPRSVYDPTADRLLVVRMGAGLEIHALALGGAPAWSALATSGTPPANAEGGVALDTRRARLLVRRWDDQRTWALSLGGSPTWTQLQTEPAGPTGGTLLYDPTEDRAVVVGGWPAPFVWALSFGEGTTGTPPPAVSRLGLRLARNPAIGALDVDLALPGPGTARVELFDLAGRRVWWRDVETQVAGARRIGAGAPGALAPGVYVVRLSRGNQAVTARGIVLR